MRTLDIIAKKRDGQALNQQEINWFIENYTNDNIPDYQVAAWLMAVYLNGMQKEEIVALTLAMANSGDTLDLSSITDYAVDKHSSGGVGDKTTLVVLPLVASLGVPIAKMSGRGLGHSGGTLDKIESFAGYSVNLDEDTFTKLAKSQGLVLAGQTRALAPADGKLYALRDVTGTVASLPLIASSIMSKKIAAGAKGIVLDVKAGKGAFMHDVHEAKQLAQMMVDIGQSIGRDMIAIISDMNQPLGYAVGNALEVVEAIETLQGAGPEDLREHCLSIADYMLKLAGRRTQWTNRQETREILEEQLDNGKAMERFRQMIAAQGGNPDDIDNLSEIHQAPIIEKITANASGFISEIAADQVANASLILGAGREKKDTAIDLRVGIVINKKVGDSVTIGETIGEIHAHSEETLTAAQQYIDVTITITNEKVEPLPLFYDQIEGF